METAPDEDLLRKIAICSRDKNSTEDHFGELLKIDGESVYFMNSDKFLDNEAIPSVILDGNAEVATKVPTFDIDQMKEGRYMYFIKEELFSEAVKDCFMPWRGNGKSPKTETKDIGGQYKIWRAAHPEFEFLKKKIYHCLFQHKPICIQYVVGKRTKKAISEVSRKRPHPESSNVQHVVKVSAPPEKKDRTRTNLITYTDDISILGTITEFNGGICYYREHPEITRTEQLMYYLQNSKVELSDSLPHFKLTDFKMGTYTFFIEESSFHSLREILKDNLSPWRSQTTAPKTERLSFNSHNYTVWRATHPVHSQMRRKVIRLLDNSDVMCMQYACFKETPEETNGFDNEDEGYFSGSTNDLFRAMVTQAVSKVTGYRHDIVPSTSNRVARKAMNKRSRVKAKEDEDLYVVEKVINRRSNAQGQLEYLLKWQGFSLEESTWEPEENIACPDLIAEYEREEKQKQLDNLTTTSCPGTSIDSELEREVDYIVGVTRVNGELYFLVKFKDSKADLIPSSKANSRWPEKVIEFYERNIKLDPVS